MNPESSSKKRAAYTDTQKRSVRQYFQRHNNPPHKEVIQWANNELGRSLDQSLIARWTSPKYVHLDKPDNTWNPSAKRHRSRKWEALEFALFEWVKRMEPMITISQALLKEKARLFFKKMAQYSEEKEPEWSSGWLANFQKQYGISMRKKYGEIGSALSINCDEEMAKIIEVLKQYPPDCQYNADETGLCWKAVPDRSLSTKVLPGKKIKKDRVSVMVSCNATGTHKLKLWFIGKAKKPLAFRARGINMDALHIVWRSNSSAWMNTQIMVEYLRWFDLQVAPRKVVLLLDNFQAHNAAVEYLTRERPSL